METTGQGSAVTVGYYHHPSPDRMRRKHLPGRGEREPCRHDHLTGTVVGWQTLTRHRAKEPNDDISACLPFRTEIKVERGSERASSIQHSSTGTNSQKDTVLAY